MTAKFGIYGEDVGAAARLAASMNLHLTEWQYEGIAHSDRQSLVVVRDQYLWNVFQEGVEAAVDSAYVDHTYADADWGYCDYWIEWGYTVNPYA